MDKQGFEPAKARQWAMFCHLGGLSFLFFAIPFGNIIVPLIIWLLKRDDFQYVSDQGKEALNFQISVTLYLIVSCILMIFAFGIILIPIIMILDIVFVVKAAIAANKGHYFRYPCTLRLIK